MSLRHLTGPSAQLHPSLTPFYHTPPFMSNEETSPAHSGGHPGSVLGTLLFRLCHVHATWLSGSSGHRTVYTTQLCHLVRSPEVCSQFLIIRRHRLLYSKPTLCIKTQEILVTQEMTRTGCLPMTGAAAAAPGHRRISRRPPCLLSLSVALFTLSSTIFSTLQIQFTQEPSPKGHLMEPFWGPRNSWRGVFIWCRVGEECDAIRNHQTSFLIVFFQMPSTAPAPSMVGWQLLRLMSRLKLWLCGDRNSWWRHVRRTLPLKFLPQFLPYQELRQWKCIYFSLQGIHFHCYADVLQTYYIPSFTVDSQRGC